MKKYFTIAGKGILKFTNTTLRFNTAAPIWEGMSSGVIFDGTQKMSHGETANICKPKKETLLHITAVCVVRECLLIHLHLHLYPP